MCALFLISHGLEGVRLPWNYFVLLVCEDRSSGCMLIVNLPRVAIYAL